VFAGRYGLLAELGLSGMGVVYRAEVSRLKRQVALKFLSEDLSARPEARARFLREAQAAAALDNPQVCTAQRTDIWSVGCVIYEMLTGHAPFSPSPGQADLYALLHGDPRPVAAFRPDAPSRFSSIVDQCSQYSPYMKTGFYDLTQLDVDASRLTEVYHARSVRLLGGEPLLNKDLPQYVSIVRATGLADSVGICTNGILLPSVSDELLRGLDCAYVSLYPLGEKYMQDLQGAADKCRRLGIRLSVHIRDVIRLMNVDEPHKDDLSRRIFHSCRIANVWRCHVIYNGHFYKCSRPIFLRQYLEKRGNQCQTDYHEKDGVSLHEPRLSHRLKSYLRERAPLLSCSYCLGTSGKEVSWKRLGEAEEIDGPAAPRDWIDMNDLKNVYV
jgi:hypothetical protein